ncbi:MAG TPA: methylmalonyl-CoA epimerase [Candidatus Limnocylindria bacterium]|nr:methylmalonyl-CoA epimerase [Candidatus Limnocylindria bacterium]
MTPRAGEVHHVAIAVPSIADALPFYRDVLGLTVGGTRDVPDQHVRISFLAAANTRVELVEPLDADTGVARFVAERGKPALHHLCFVVDDLAGTLDRLAARGVELVDRVPRAGAEGDVAFLHPRASDGVLVELIDRKTIR